GGSGDRGPPELPRARGRERTRPDRAGAAQRPTGHDRRCGDVRGDPGRHGRVRAGIRRDPRDGRRQAAHLKPTPSTPGGPMTEIPAELADFVTRLAEFIEREIKPLEEEHIEFFDHRREWRRTDWENGGVHRRE